MDLNQRHLFVMAENYETAKPYIDEFVNQGHDATRVHYGALVHFITANLPHETAFAFHTSFPRHSDYAVLSHVASDIIEQGALVFAMPKTETQKSIDDFVAWLENVTWKGDPDFMGDILEDDKPKYAIFYVGGPAEGEEYKGAEIYPGTYHEWRGWNGGMVAYQCVEAEILGERLKFLISPDIVAESEKHIRKFVLGELEAL